VIHKFLSEIAYKMPDKVAVIQGKRCVTYGDLYLGVSRLAAFLLDRGVQVSDRVAIMILNSPEYIISYLGVQQAGGISVALNPQYSAYELKKIFDNCLPDVLVVERKYLKAVMKTIDNGTSLKTLIIVDSQGMKGPSLISNKKEKVISGISCFNLQDILKNAKNENTYPAITEKDIASIHYTSGTTGEPKGVMLSHSNFITNANSIIKYLNLTEDDRAMVVLPFYYSYGTSVLTTHIKVCGSLVLENSFMYPNVVLDKMVEEEVTGFAGVPSTFAILLNRSNIRNYSFSKLRYVTQAGGPMPPGHTRELAEILSDTEIYIMYGQTEATARLTYLPPEDLLKRPGSIGKPVPAVEIELIKTKDVEEKEIVCTGGNVMVGYWNDPEETKKVLRGGRLYTGDTARMDDEGYLYIVGRKSDMIKSGAHRISPKEIEEIILEMPEVHEAAVVGIEDEVMGESIKAVIVLKDGLKMEAKKVQKHCMQKLAPFKIPKEVVFVKDYPRTSSGKVQKHLLKTPQKVTGHKLI